MSQFYEINASPPQSPTEQLKMSTLFLGDLSALCDEEKLLELFRPYGPIESIHLKKSTRDPSRGHLGFGFIKFVNHEDAERAITELNGLFFLGRAMRVGWGKDFDKLHMPVDGLEKLVDPKKHRQTAQIHVTFVSRELHKRVSEMDLGAVFGTFGNVVDIAIKKNAINEEHLVQPGYAFIHFELSLAGLQSAISAVEQVNCRVIDNIAYQCKKTHTLQAQILAMIGVTSAPTSPPIYHPPMQSYKQPATPINPSTQIFTRQEKDFELPQKHLVHSAVQNVNTRKHQTFTTYDMSSYHTGGRGLRKNTYSDLRFDSYGATDYETMSNRQNLVRESGDAHASYLQARSSIQPIDRTCSSYSFRGGY